MNSPISIFISSVQKELAADLPEPEFNLTNGFVTILRRKLNTRPVAPPVGTKSAPSRHQVTSVTDPVAGQVGEQVGEQVIAILSACSKEPQSKTALLQFAGLTNAYMNYKRHIVPLLEQALIEMTIPDKPNSRLQKYQLTAKGRAWLASLPNLS